jgi:Effector-associated domain 1
VKLILCTARGDLGVHRMDASRADALTGPQRGGLADALREAYPIPDQLEMMLTHWLDKPYGTLENGEYKSSIYRLIEAAKSQGWLHELINAAMKDRSKNPALKKWADSVDWCTRPQASAEAQQQNAAAPAGDQLGHASPGDDVLDNVPQLDQYRRKRDRTRRPGATRGAPGPGVPGSARRQVPAEWEALITALHSARFDPSDWRAMSSGTSRLRKELARPRAPHPAFPRRVDDLVADLATTLATVTQGPTSRATLRAASARCDRMRNWLLHLLVNPES